MSHGDQLTSLPPNFITIASTPTSPFTSIAHKSQDIFGVQFHPEVSHSPKGKEVIAAFVKNVCGIQGGWSMVSPPQATSKLELIGRTLSSPRRLPGSGRSAERRGRSSVLCLEE
jgi:hypothetical protein